jgi:hypothetical protein
MRRYAMLGHTKVYVPQPSSPPDPEDWVIYYAAKDITLRRLSVRKGELFPFQDKRLIRSYLKSLSPNIERRSLLDEPLLRTLRVPRRLYSEVIRDRLNYLDALALVRRYRGA